MSKTISYYQKAFVIALAMTLVSTGCAQEVSPEDTTEIPVEDGAINNGDNDRYSSNLGNSQTGTFGNSEQRGNASIGDAACGAISSQAKQIEVKVPTQVEVEVIEPGPVAIYLMLDQSGSMMEPSLASIKWWDEVNAVTTFVNDPNSINVDMSLQYFPLLLGDCASGFGYNMPEVPMARLPDNAKNITDSLTCHIPVMGGLYTPLEGALRGMTDYCISFKQDKTANPDGEDCVGVLVTDGLPTMCNQDSAALIDFAANAYKTNKVRTFTIGMAGADFNLLEKIAQAGNGDCTSGADPSWTCDVSTGKITFLDALNNIRGSITTLKTRTEMQTKLETKKLDCKWSIPEPPKGEVFDKDLINVQFSATGLTQGFSTLGRVDYESKCGVSANSWYYDKLTDPSAIVACPKTCDEIKAADKGKISIMFGCKTVLTVL
jgi:hypothetical protein